MKPTLCLLLWLCSAMSLLASDSTEYDFRKVRWGMTETEVVKSEGKKPSSKEEESTGSHYIVYATTMGSLGCNVLYFFNDSNQLYQVQVAFTVKHATRSELFIDDFQTINEVLQKKYGAPTVDDVIWGSERSEKSYDGDVGLALTLGDLTYRSEWDTDRTHITHMVYGENYKIDHRMWYESKTYTQEISTDGF